MERFCESIEDPELQWELFSAIRGSGAFRRFKDTIWRMELDKQWYAFLHTALESIAVPFLEAHGIAYKRQ